MLRLDFTLADLSLPQQRETTRRVSISGVQDKVQLHRQGMRFVPVASGGKRQTVSGISSNLSQVTRPHDSSTTFPPTRR